MTACCMTFLLSGYETIASVLAYTSYLLALNLDVQDQLCTAIDSLNSVRLYTCCMHACSYQFAISVAEEVNASRMW